MTGVDLSAGFLEEARAAAPEVEWLRVDMRALPWADRFDAAYCWGNSFAYFEHAECRRFPEAVARALRRGGCFILDSGAVAESLLPALQTERRLQIGDIDFHSRNVYDAFQSRMDITYTFARGSCREINPIHQWVHTAGEIRRMLEEASLEPLEAWGDLAGSPYAVGSSRLIALARRV